MISQISEYINSLKQDVALISTTRKNQLRNVTDFVWSRLKDGKSANLAFICTHNSRRSQLCQIWTATLAEHFGLENINTYSGGTEVTAFNPRAVEAIRRAGFKVENPGGENPRYKVFFNDEKEPLVCYSKKFDDEANPKEDFAAVMTCMDADRNCPVVPGTAFRTTIPYEDPGQADGTPKETQIYDERCRQIAAEMYYMLSQLN